ncbi:MAG TPA: fimbria/pilus periplasmic chaperone [Casimicrobiaceae bacterium]|nr:fimbria/pilus periplasmic chaperone [Casimicrobiaceae bacterium]
MAPIRVDLSAAVRIAAVTVTSEDDHPLVFKNSPSSWTQDADGNDVYAPSNDLVLTPPLLRVEATEPRTVRIGTLRAPGDVERSYRVFLEEQPAASREGSGTNIAVVIKFGVPIFVAPLSERVAGELTVVERKRGSMVLQVRNTGNVHFNVESVAANAVPLKDVSSWYLLAGTTRRYALAVPPEACAGPTVELRVKTTRNILTATVAASDVCPR